MFTVVMSTVLKTFNMHNMLNRIIKISKKRLNGRRLVSIVYHFHPIYDNINDLKSQVFLYSHSSNVSSLPEKLQDFSIRLFLEHTIVFKVMVISQDYIIVLFLLIFFFFTKNRRERNLPTIPSTLGEEKLYNPFMRTRYDLNPFIYRLIST